MKTQPGDIFAPMEYRERTTKQITWPTIQQQIDYWNKKEELSRTEATADWYDNVREDWYWNLRDEGRSDGQGESYSERNT